jgi:hypothetical protein
MGTHFFAVDRVAKIAKNCKKLQKNCDKMQKIARPNRFYPKQLLFMRLLFLQLHSKAS